MRGGEFYYARPDFFLADIPQAKRRGEPAVIRTRSVGTGPAFDPFRRRMQRREPFGQLRSEKGERRHAAKGHEMAGTGIVANEHAGAVCQRNQFRHGDGRGHAGLARPQPPRALVGVAGDLNLNFFLPQARGEIFISFQRPDADGLSGAGVNQHRPPARHGRERDFFARGQFDGQSAGHGTPGFITMRLRFRMRDGLRQKVAADAETGSQSGVARQKVSRANDRAGRRTAEGW